MPEDRPPCRDFQRGVCTRGDNCRYFHPETATLAEDVKPPICKDYQNSTCDRMKCKFLHITQNEEAVFKATGMLPEHGGRAENIPRQSSVINNDICKDFLNGKCDRGARCKYVHETDPKILIREMYGKRSRAMANSYDGGLFEENEMLRCKITELQKEVISLRQMNDTLYDQNTKYRSQLHKGTVPAMAAYDTVYPQYPVVYPTITSSVPVSAGSPLSAYSARPF